MHTLQTFQAIINSSVFGVFIYQEEGKIVFANKRIAEILGYDSPDELLGKSIFEIIGANKEEIKEAIKRRTQGEAFVLEYKERFLLSKSNAIIPVSVFAYTVEYNNKPSGLVLVLDKTKEKSYEKLFFTLSQINQLIVRTDDEKELLKKACDIIVDEVGYLDCAVGYIDQNNLFNQIYTRAKTKELEEELKKITIGVDENTPYGKGSVSKAYHTKKVSLIPEISKLPYTSYWHDFFEKYNIHSACSIPILKKGKIVYIMLILDTLSNSFDQDRIHLLEELALDLSFALEKIDSQKNMLVLDKAINLSHEWVVITDKEGTIIDANDAVCKISGYSKDELIGKNPRVFKSGYHDRAFYENLWKKILSGQTCSCRFVNKAKDGSIFYLDSIIIPIIQNGKIYRFVDLSRDVTKLVRYQDQLELKSKIYNTLYQISSLSFRTKSKEEFLQNLPKIIVDNLDMEISYVALKNDGNIEIAHHLARDFQYSNYLDKAKILIKSIARNPPLNYHTPLLKSLKKKGIYLVNEIDSHGFCPFKKIVSSCGIKSCCAISIVSKNEIIGTLVITSSKPNLFNREIYSLFRVIQNQIEFILDKLQDDRFSQITLSALNSGFEFVIITDSNFNIVYVNDKATEISGYSRQELLGKHHSVFSSKTHSKEFAKNFYNTLKSGEVYSGIMQYKIKNGSIKDFYVNITPFFEEKVITHYISVGKEIVKDDELLEELEKLLNYDATTGLINIYSFKKAVERFIERATYEKTIGAVAIINPIDFKKINEAFGFETGNSILQQIAKRLTDNLRSYDRVSKLESDRFGLLLKDLKAEEDILIVISKLLLELTKPYKAKDKSISISFNIGLSLFPKDATTPDGLLDKAHIALSDAKEKGENQIGFFRKELEKDATRLLQLKADLELALLNKEFIAYYQPYVDRNQKIVGAEALMRWKKDNRIIPPAEFIEYLEQTSLIIDAQELIIDQVLEDLKLLKKPVPISINLSTQSLKQRHLSDNLISNINYHNIPNNLIKLEIIERTLLNNFEYVARLIKELKENNILFSLDDFGTGYSSLSYLASLDVEILKIDISFVRDLDNPKTKSIVDSIIYLAHSLGIKTIAEGVETQYQFETLKSMNCDYFQGYLFYKPMDKQELIQAIEQIDS
ncbi:MAG: EAL domain-containing protein [Desulfurella sp.]|uniref:EAL domain-containing protein n=1 Tax=Desulfurella sp. TaxID=1962857 RepID=UPI003D105202